MLLEHNVFFLQTRFVLITSILDLCGCTHLVQEKVSILKWVFLTADKYPILTKNVILPQCLHIIETGSRGQVKRAMACLSQHTSSNRDVVLHKVLSVSKNGS